MGFPETIFKVIEENNCPLYEIGDVFKLGGKAIFLKNNERTFITTAIIRVPEKKKPCRILIADITSVLIEFGGMSDVPKYVTNCSGCSGRIRIEYVNKRKGGQPHQKITSGKPSGKKTEPSHIDAIVRLLGKFSIFQTLEDEEIRKLVPLLKLAAYKPGDFVIKKGDPGKNLYIIVSGSIQVLGDEGVHIAFLGKGEVFGELSLLSGDPIGASIQVVESTRLLYMNGKSFRMMLHHFPPLQMYFTRLLAKRLAQTNVGLSEELSSGIVGKLSDMSPSELFQTLNVNQKTGVLNMRLPKGPAVLAFREGSLVDASYDGVTGKEAFYEMLKAKTGRFKFVPGLGSEYDKLEEFGDFMWLLMEGLNRIDEGR